MRIAPAYKAFNRLLAGLLLGLAAARGAAQEPIEWLTDDQFDAQLEQDFRGTWAERAVRDGLRSLSANTRVATLLDRRVDPGELLDLNLQDKTLREALEAIAADRRVGLSIVGPVAYLGPTATAERLRTVAALRAEDVEKLPLAARRAWQRRRPMRWADLATPRQLLADIGAAAGIEMVGIEELPHDLWAAADLPPLSLAEALTLVLGQFDATFEIASNGRQIALRPLPEEVAIERTFPAGAQAAAQARKYRELLPRCDVTVAGGKIVVRGRLEDIERIDVAQSGTRTVTRITAEPEKNYTLTVERKPLRAVLGRIAEDAMLTMEIDGASLEREGISLDDEVTFTVENATLDKLLEAAVSAAGLKFRREGQTVEVFAGGE